MISVQKQEGGITTSVYIIPEKCGKVPILTLQQDLCIRYVSYEVDSNFFFFFCFQIFEFSKKISMHLWNTYCIFQLPRWCSGKESQETWIQFDPWLEEIPWIKKWQPAPVFLLGKCRGQRRLVEDSSWHNKEWDTTEWLSTHTHTHTHTHKHTVYLALF